MANSKPSVHLAFMLGESILSRGMKDCQSGGISSLIGISKRSGTAQRIKVVAHGVAVLRRERTLKPWHVQAHSKGNATRCNPDEEYGLYSYVRIYNKHGD